MIPANRLMVMSRLAGGIDIIWHILSTPHRTDRGL